MFVLWDVDCLISHIFVSFSMVYLFVSLLLIILVALLTRSSNLGISRHISVMSSCGVKGGEVCLAYVWVCL